MTAFSADSIESTTVVGYQTLTIPAGFSLWTPTFVDVNAETFDLANFKLGDEALGDSSEQIQVLNADGINNETWVWLNKNAGMTPGWYDINTWEPITKSISVGTGYLINVTAPVTLEMKGVVFSQQRTMTLPAGFNVFGNSSPVEIALASIKLGANALGDCSEQIQVLDADGINNETWIWLNENAGMTPGWYDINTWEPVVKTVDPGQAFLFNATQDSSVTLPSAL